ncbi:MAG: aminoacylase [Deltaproteobacteria bacterium]|nr:MAG: aminoacylase [Deltaproteobacteria bacterium]
MRLLLDNATVVDGTGAPGRVGRVLIEDDAIAEVDAITLVPDEVLDCEGMVVAPGFIDMHSHSDFTLVERPLVEAKVMQGVTTEVVGNCGIGLITSNDEVDRLYEKLLPLVSGERGGTVHRSVAAFREAIDGLGGVSVNVAPLIPHGNVRCAAMGMVERRANLTELHQMRELVDGGMRDGAFGMSTGLIYPPGAFAEAEELTELAKCVAPYDGIYATHMRDEGSRLVESVEEAIAIGEAAEVSVQLSHHKAAGRFNWGKVKKSLRLVEEARARSIDVHSDVYPYTAGSTVLSAMFLPLWVFEGSWDEMLARLTDPATRERIIEDSNARFLDFARLPGVWDRIVPKRLLLPLLLRHLSKLVVVNSVRRQHQYEGMSLYEIRKARKQGLYDMLLDLLAEEDAAVSAIADVMSEDDVRYVMKHDTTMFGTDGFNPTEGKPHPRTYGTYPRILERYVRELGLFSLESAVHKMTGMVADKLGIGDRGRVLPGHKADLVVFSPGRVHDRATYAESRRTPTGMPHVFVNGAWTVRDGRHTGARAAGVLRKDGPRG